MFFQQDYEEGELFGFSFTPKTGFFEKAYAFF
jgi:hypothetical protein